MTRIFALIVVASAFVSACSPPPVASHSQTSTTSAASSQRGGSPLPSYSSQPLPASAARTSIPVNPPSSGLLFAALEGGSPTGSEPNTVVVVGMDGYARAKATFTPRQRPYVGNAGVPLQPMAQVVGSGVYYIDGYGTVRVLRANRQPVTVATFSEQPVQYETWFAVKPDGSEVVAGILQFPAIGPVPSPCEGMCLPPLVGGWNFNLVHAAGGTNTVLKHVESPTSTDASNSDWKPEFPIGWVAAGPVVMLPVSIGTQNAWWGGPLHLLDPSGGLAAQLGGPDCNAASITGGQFIPCTSGQYAVTIRDFSGRVLWSSQIEGVNALQLHLSPDGQAIADDFQVETRAYGLITMPSGFQVQGWLDNGTVIGRKYIGNGPDQGDLSWISLSDSSTIHDLGFKGDFVGAMGS